VSVAAPFESELREEVWLSLISVLRAYAALALLKDGVHIAVSASDPEEVILRSQRARLAIALQSDGMGRCVIMAGGGVVKESMFEIAEDGTLTRDGIAVELDLAAIEWVEMLVALERKAEGGND
jgi:sulfur transfer complex TusBCD TusB component (DsrH family)